MRKNKQCFFLIRFTNRYSFQLSLGCTHFWVHWRDHASKHGKRSLKMLTVERADYTQEKIVISSIPGQ